MTDLVNDGADCCGIGEVDEVHVGLDGDAEEERRVRATSLRPLHPNHRLQVVPRLTNVLFHIVASILMLDKLFRFRLEDVALKQVLVQVLDIQYTSFIGQPIKGQD